MNEFIARVINRSTTSWIRRNFVPFIDEGKLKEEPVLVVGAFRSGTSLTTHLLIAAGLDAGPQHHLLQSNGKFAAHTPDGFMENYFFMELSRYIFYLSKSNGDDPPKNEIIEALDFEKMNDAEFREYAVMELRESRISNKHKADVLKNASVLSPRAYIAATFNRRAVIKNPHFSVLEPYFQKLFPMSARVVVFRNPGDWVRSAKAVTAKADDHLYDAYYQYYLSHQDGKNIFFDYDQLMMHPKESIEALCVALNLPTDNLPALQKLVRSGKINHVAGITQSKNWHQLQQLAINR